MSNSPFYKTGVSKSPLYQTAAQTDNTKKVDLDAVEKKEKKAEVNASMKKTLG